jgi:branched-chain amino acid transport system permease protein
MKWPRGRWREAAIALAVALPLIDYVLPASAQFASRLIPIFIFAILGLGLNLVTGSTGLLNLGAAAFMAIGAYTYAILTCDIYPFQIGFWLGLVAAIAGGALGGIVLGLPTMRLRGDYLAIVTLGFGEIVQDLLRNLQKITMGTHSINPLPPPSFGSAYVFTSATWQPWYYLYLFLLIVVVIALRNLGHSRIGRTWIAIREDELAARCMGISVPFAKLAAFATGSACCALAGALYAAHLGSSGDPGNYDFQMSTLALCIVILGGMGSIDGVLLGALLVMGFNSIVLDKIQDVINRHGGSGTSHVLATPNNWKYLIFGMTLIVMMRIRPEGLLPSKRRRLELHEQDPQTSAGAAS